MTVVVRVRNPVEADLKRLGQSPPEGRVDFPIHLFEDAFEDPFFLFSCQVFDCQLAGLLSRDNLKRVEAGYRARLLLTLTLDAVLLPDYIQSLEEENLNV